MKLDKQTIFNKIERLYEKILKQEIKLHYEVDEKNTLKRLKKLKKLSRKLVKKKIKLHSNEILNARKLKQNGILIPLTKEDKGTVYTDEIIDESSLIELAKLKNWTKKCCWIDLVSNKNYIIYLDRDPSKKVTETMVLVA